MPAPCSLAFLIASCHGHVRRDLADVMLAVDHGGDFAFALDFRLGAQIVGVVLDELQILRHPGDAVAGIAAQLGFNEQFGDEIGIVTAAVPRRGRRSQVGCRKSEKS